MEKVSQKVARAWLKKQAIWQVYLPAPCRIPTPNNVHHADLLFLPDDTLGRGQGHKTYTYALLVVDVASGYKEAEPLTTKEATEVTSTF